MSTVQSIHCLQTGIPQRRAQHLHLTPKCGILHADVQAGWMCKATARQPAPKGPHLWFQHGCGASCTHQTGDSNTCLQWHFCTTLRCCTERFHLEGNQVLSAYRDNRHISPMDPAVVCRTDGAAPFLRINGCRKYLHTQGLRAHKVASVSPGTIKRLQLATSCHWCYYFLGLEFTALLWDMQNCFYLLSAFLQWKPKISK